MIPFPVQWIDSRPDNATCPVCKSVIDREKVIPLYGRGAKEQSDPRVKVPPRPQGQREEPQHAQHQVRATVEPIKYDETAFFLRYASCIYAYI